MKNFLLFLNQQFSFSAKNEYKLVAERRAAARREANKSLKNPDWRGIVDNVRTILQQQTEYIYIPDLSP